jgi:hypothetical protein
MANKRCGLLDYERIGMLFLDRAKTFGNLLRMHLENLQSQIWGTKLHVAACHDSESVSTGFMRTSGFLNRRSQVRVLSGTAIKIKSL